MQKLDDQKRVSAKKQSSLNVKRLSFRSTGRIGEIMTEEQELQDSLIKSFMVIFTHESSHHLLLNEDLVSIAFYCLEYCSEISSEAK